MSDKTNPLFVTAILFATGILVVECVFLDIYHEEPTRLLVAQSMLESGNWIVPHILGEIYLKKPPGYNWAVALLSLGYGEVTAVSGRLVAVLSWLGLGVFVWTITDELQNRFHRILAVFSLLFSATVLVEKAALAEIDLFFAAVLTAAVWVWYRGIKQQQPISGTIGSHLLLALALLTKGPVAYLFFYTPILFLGLGSNRSFSWRKLGGGFLFGHALVGLWAWYVLKSVGFSTYYDVVIGETLGRSSTGGIGSYLEQFVKMPITAFGAFMPGTFLLGYLAVRDRVSDSLYSFWKRDDARMALGGLVPFLFFWIFPVDSTRYILPLAPWGAVLVGVWFDEATPNTLTRDSLITVTKICGGALVLVSPLPWFLESEQGVMVGFSVLLPASIVIALIGLGVFFSDRFPGHVSNNCFAGLLTFCLVLKIGYLFLYVPIEKTPRIRTRFQINQHAGTIKKNTGEKTILYLSDNKLEIPYYLKKQGLRVKKVTDRRPDPHSPVITRDADALSEKWSMIDRIQLPDGDVYYVYVPNGR